MSGWSRQKRLDFEQAFYDYLGQCFIYSKNVAGLVCLGENLYLGQRRFLSMVFDGLEADVHKFFVLKSRQLGLTTISRALSVFYLGIHRGLKGALVFDTAPNREEARSEILNMISDLPPALGFPRVTRDNRDELTLSNKSKILFKSAGVKKSKSSGTLGRSVGLAMAHLSELCSYDNDEGLISFDRSLSQVHPDRLYIYESTARGFGRWYEMWKEARKDTAHCSCLFVGWWAHPNQTIDEDDADFERYCRPPPSAKELEKIRYVKAHYDVAITPGQLGWIRRQMDPNAEAGSDFAVEFEGDVLQVQEDPWTEEEAFQQTGAVFFPPEKLADQSNRWVSPRFNSYMYAAGQEFVDMRVFKAPNQRSIELKVWDEPDPLGTYVVAADPAYGENENNDRSAVQVLRCYADGLDQVAEYAWPLVTTQQFAWVIASLLGWYGENNAEVYFILELNGPGDAVWNEFRSLRNQINQGYKRKDFDERGLARIFDNVRNYIYSRTDALHPSRSNYHFKTTPRLKVTLMERCRDFISNGLLHVKSADLIEEMRTITRDGDSICAPGAGKDDRAYALAMAVHNWEQRVRPGLTQHRRTREAEAARTHLSITNQVYLFQKNQLQTFFDTKQKARRDALLRNQHMRWRYGRTY